ncbi:hypothetical protein ACFVHW_04310 [Streptomyces sp. NPDC127110]|uniref:hypothetical protein n=1 Tax=Streptomyces sp. NPDC127110 TaxID=3345362 RepID=UPI00362D4D29
MPVIDAEFIPVIITARPLVDPVSNLTYQQPPAGTDPGALRILRARQIRPGDWVLGDCEQPTRSRRGVYWGVHAFAAWAAIPVLDAAAGSVALDGQTPNWDPDEWVMVVPREFVPLDAYHVGYRVERSLLHTPDVWDNRHRRSATGTRYVIQRGTVTAVDPDGLVTVQWAGQWLDSSDNDAGIRRVDPATVNRERAVYGFAVGDPVPSESGAPGTVMELWRHWWAGTPMVRIFWPDSAWGDATGRFEVAAAARYVRAASPAA